MNQDMFLKLLGVAGVLGLVGQAAWSIIRHYRKVWRDEPRCVVYYRDRNPVEDEKGGD